METFLQLNLPLARWHWLFVMLTKKKKIYPGQPSSLAFLKFCIAIVSLFWPSHKCLWPSSTNLHLSNRCLSSSTLLNLRRAILVPPHSDMNPTHPLHPTLPTEDLLFLIVHLLKARHIYLYLYLYIIYHLPSFKPAVVIPDSYHLNTVL